MVVLCSFTKWSIDIHCEKFEGSGCWKKLKFPLFAECRIIPCASLAPADYAISICGHVRTINLA